MGKFIKMIKKKEKEKMLANHPLASIKEEEKKDYLQSLVFLAVEDENFSDEEKEYIAFVNKAIGLDESMLEQFETFANDPDEIELMALIERLKAMDETIKLYLLVDICVVAFKDGEFDSGEMEVLDEYLDILDMVDKKQTVLYLAKIINQKDVDNAIAFKLSHQEVFEKFKHLFELLDMNIDKAIEELYTYEWVKWELIDGEIENNNKVATKPVSVRQFTIFANSLIMNQALSQVPETTRFELNLELSIDEEQVKLTDELFIYEMDFTNMTFEDGLFSFENSDRDEPIVGQGPLNIIIFEKWFLHEKMDLLELNCLKLKGSNSGYIVFHPDCVGKPETLNEIFCARYPLEYKYYTSAFFDGSYMKGETIPSLKEPFIGTCTFRLMRSK